MLVIFIVYTASVTLFTHVHVVCGVPIVFSHFYDFWDDDTSEVGILKLLVNCFSVAEVDGAQYPDEVPSNLEGINSSPYETADSKHSIPVKEHHHSSASQLIFYEMTSTLNEVILPILFFFIVPILSAVDSQKSHLILCYVERLFLLSYSLRGPPCLVLS